MNRRSSESIQTGGQTERWHATSSSIHTSRPSTQPALMSAPVRLNTNTFCTMASKPVGGGGGMLVRHDASLTRCALASPPPS